MKIVTKVELSQNDKTFIEQLNGLLAYLITDTVFKCEDLACENCPLYCNRCEVDRLQSAIEHFIELTEDI